MPELILPIDNRSTRVKIDRASAYRPPSKPLTSRIAYAAGHVVAKNNVAESRTQAPSTGTRPWPSAITSGPTAWA